MRVAGDPAAHLDAVRRIAAAAAVDGPHLVIPLERLEQQTPAIVTALVASGAEVLEVRPEIPALEEVYLRLVNEP